MHEIKTKIDDILRAAAAEDWQDEIIESSEDDAEAEYPEQYVDVYVAIHNADGFYQLGSSPVANRLLNSFLLETTTLLRANLDTIYLESGIDFVKATVACPDAEIASYLLEDAAKINTMFDLYNEALTKNKLPHLEVGIALNLYLSGEEADLVESCEGDDCENDCDCDCEGKECDCDCDDDCDNECDCGDECDCDDEECDCDDDECDCDHDHDHDHECNCGHHHHDDEEFEYPVDYDNGAYNLAQFAGSDSIEAIILSESFYSLLNDLIDEMPFLPTAFEEIEIEALDQIAYHGSLTAEE
jgi:hypothetical protein